MKMQSNKSEPSRFRIHRTKNHLFYQNFIQGQDKFHEIDDFDFEEHAFGMLQQYTPHYAETI